MSVPFYTSEKGVSDKAEVTVSADKVIVKLQSSGQIYTIFPEDCPRWLQKSGVYNITLNAGGSKILSCRPGKPGSYFAFFSRFAFPEPRLVEESIGKKADGQTFKIERHLEFIPVFAITGGEYNGFEVSMKLWYTFRPVGNPAIVAVPSKGKVLNFLIAAGLDLQNDTIMWSDNILPDLEKLLTSKNKLMIIQLTDRGWISNLAEAPAGIEISH